MRGIFHCKVSCSPLFKASLLLAGSASRHRDQFARGGKTIIVSFEEFKRKDTSVVNILALGYYTLYEK